jgi:MarR family 2-MHQ and catechol resistance regulon transcriptional repressor
MVIKHVGKETGISQNELSNQLFVSAANITKLIDGLEKKEWVVRGSYDNDRRVKLIKITDKGSKLLDTVWLEHVKAINNILDNFSQADKEALNKYLEGFRKEMETRSSKLE